MFLRYLTERRPALSAVVVVLLYTVGAAAVYFGLTAAFSGRVNAEAAVVAYSFFIGLALWLTTERPILAFLPFITMLIGFIFAEIIYTVSMGSNPPGEGPDAAALLISSGVVTVFGAEAAGYVGAFLCFLAVTVVKKIFYLIRYR